MIANKWKRNKSSEENAISSLLKLWGGDVHPSTAIKVHLHPHFHWQRWVSSGTVWEPSPHNTAPCINCDEVLASALPNISLSCATCLCYAKGTRITTEVWSSNHMLGKGLVLPQLGFSAWSSLRTSHMSQGSLHPEQQPQGKKRKGPKKTGYISQT